MVKVTKWAKQKKKEDWGKYRAEIKGLKYGIFENIRWAMREVYKYDKLVIFAALLMAFGDYFRNVILTYTDKYVVELAAGGFGQRRLVIICLLLFAGNFLFRSIVLAAHNYKGYVGFRRLVDYFYDYINTKIIAL